MEFKRCYNCMEELDSPGAVCPQCGCDNTNDPKDPEKQPIYVLPCGMVLNGRYVVGRMLGQGGFGITYIGWNLTFNMPVCIKEYFPQGAAMRSATQSGYVLWSAGQNAQINRESFVKEAQKAVALRNLGHVVKVWDVFYENDTAYIVMDYIEGETLKNRLVRTQKTLSEKECVELLTPIMEDLEKAHTRGIIHRDIKPDNIMLTAEGKPMLLDMGTVNDLYEKNWASHGFRPTEQYCQKGNIGPWTDVYAMCATVYYCVSGKVPPNSLDRLAEGNENDLHAFSPAMAAVLEKGMALRVQDRIQTMGELLADLSGLKQDEREQTYQAAKKYLAHGDAPELISALTMLTSLGSYRDAGKLAADCKERLEAMKNKNNGQPEGKNEKKAAGTVAEKKKMRIEERLFLTLMFTLAIGGNIAGFTAPRNGKIILLVVNFSIVLLIIPMAKLFIRIAGRKSQPPDILYYSASEDCAASITAQGLTPKHGTYVFLSQTNPMADTQKRQTGETFFAVQAGKMDSDGYVFYQTAKSWKTEMVPPEYVGRIRPGEVHTTCTTGKK